VTLSRRHFLAYTSVLLARLFFPGPSMGAGPGNPFTWAQLRYAGTWNPNPRAASRFLFTLARRTSVEVHTQPKPVKLTHSEIFDLPFLYVSGRSSLPDLRDLARANLRRYVENGGFVLFDDASGIEDSAFFLSASELISGIFPGRRIAPLSSDHTVFQSFYLLQGLAGRKIVKPFLYGMAYEDLTPVILCQNDLSGAWDGDASGYTYNCTPGGEHQREMTFRLGINLVMYALTGNYKKDQVHIPFILKRRQLVK